MPNDMTIHCPKIPFPVLLVCVLQKKSGLTTLWKFKGKNLWCMKWYQGCQGLQIECNWFYVLYLPDLCANMGVTLVIGFMSAGGCAAEVDDSKDLPRENGKHDCQWQSHSGVVWVISSLAKLYLRELKTNPSPKMKSFLILKKNT